MNQEIIIKRFEERILNNPQKNNPEYLRGLRATVVESWRNKQVEYEEMSILTALIDRALNNLGAL